MDAIRQPNPEEEEEEQEEECRRVLSEVAVADMATEPGINMEAKIDARENPFEPYLDALKKVLEDQEPIFMIGIVVSLAVVVITVGKFRLSTPFCSRPRTNRPHSTHWGPDD